MLLRITFVKFILLIAAIFIVFSASGTAQVFSGGGGGGSGRHCAAGGGSLALHLAATNNFPENKALGFACGTLNRSTSAYVVCFKNTNSTPGVEEALFSCKVTVENGAGEVDQAGVVGGKVVGVDYKAKARQNGGPIVETLKISGEQYDLNKGRVFVVSEFGQETKVKQYSLKNVTQADVEAFLELILDIAETKTPPIKKRNITK